MEKIEAGTTSELINVVDFPKKLLDEPLPKYLYIIQLKIIVLWKHKPLVKADGIAWTHELWSQRCLVEAAIDIHLQILVPAIKPYIRSLLGADDLAI